MCFAWPAQHFHELNLTLAITCSLLHKFTTLPSIPLCLNLIYIIDGHQDELSSSPLMEGLVCHKQLSAPSGLASVAGSCLSLDHTSSRAAPIQRLMETRKGERSGHPGPTQDESNGSFSLQNPAEFG